MDIALDLMAFASFGMMFIAPFAVVIIVWKHSKLPKLLRILVGLALGTAISLICWVIYILILFRGGMGP